MTCSHADCPEPPRWRPALDLRSKPRATTRRLRFQQLGYCERHRHHLTLATFLSEEGFEKIARRLREEGRGHLDRRSTTLVWEPLTAADLRRLAPRQHRTIPSADPAGDTDPTS